MFTLIFNALIAINEQPALLNKVDLNTFQDAGEITAWAKEAVLALVQADIVQGSNNRLYPTSVATRAEIAQVLLNLLKK